MKVTRLTLGDLPSCPRGLGPPQGGPTGRQKSAEARTPQRMRRKAEQEEPNRLEAFDA